MLTIKKITDQRLGSRVCASLDADVPGAYAYAAYQDENVLASAAFLTEAGGCVTFLAVDAGRREDIAIIDGLARAAFFSQMKSGAKTAKLGDKLPEHIRLALTKLSYTDGEAFSLAEFFAKKNCAK